MSSVIPHITSIKPDDLAPRYVWVDEDDNQVSPVHRNFRTALNFVNGWHERWEKLLNRYGNPTPENLHQFESGYVQMSKTGKPPIKSGSLSKWST
jgi:hypothetical protein